MDHLALDDYSKLPITLVMGGDRELQGGLTLPRQVDRTNQRRRTPGVDGMGHEHIAAPHRFRVLGGRALKLGAIHLPTRGPKGNGLTISGRGRALVVGIGEHRGGFTDEFLAALRGQGLAILRRCEDVPNEITEIGVGHLV